ncbi:hypothetical protein SVIO_095900 [Streptomyces violaceusniger]|uniref:Uncharacterized protein n=1 Tax=Streptomyces violaceusniger TaxID=68280 RepID=A0A4D4LKW1_STRVO|nr:hypothetical protein SVIO_095900 [Streptomyces violaceusniger]
MGQGVDHMGTVPHQRGALGVRADEEAGRVDQEHHRQPEPVAQPREASDLVRGRRVDRPGQHQRLARHEADRPTVDPAEGRDQVGGEIRAQLQDFAEVGEADDDFPHVVGPPGVRRHDVPQGGGRRHRFGRLQTALEVRQVGRDQVVHPGLVRRHRVRRAGRGVHPRGADLLRGQPLAQRGLHQRRPGHSGRRALRGHHEVAQPGEDRVSRERPPRHRAYGRHPAGEAGERGEDGLATATGAQGRLLHSVSRALGEDHHRQGAFLGELEHPGQLGVVDIALAARQHGVVVGGDGERAATQPGDAGDEAVRGGVEFRLRRSGEHSVLAERAGVGQRGHPLARGPPAPGSLPGDGLGAGGVGGPAPEFLQRLDGPRSGVLGHDIGTHDIGIGHGRTVAQSVSSFSSQRVAG